MVGGLLFFKISQEIIRKYKGNLCYFDGNGPGEVQPTDMQRLFIFDSKAGKAEFILEYLYRGAICTKQLNTCRLLVARASKAEIAALGKHDFGLLIFLPLNKVYKGRWQMGKRMKTADSRWYLGHVRKQMPSVPGLKD